ncbi:carbonic anhydrase [Heliocybe sulcata]|uniref:Carbonic anhydrase n=1 Tax=Heliocybe sulcata TaxID=5364 RepID=A0A5C3NN70_9AGAM|nr:carbonic anhydrase [Heliocybe sulcata]
MVYVAAAHPNTVPPSSITPILVDNAMRTPFAISARSSPPYISGRSPCTTLLLPARHSSAILTKPPAQRHRRNMSSPTVDHFLAASEEYRKTFGDKGSLQTPPVKKLAVGRVSKLTVQSSVVAHLGLKEGDAHIIRNAGGSARDALRSIIISQRLLGTREVAVFHHTKCGMLTFSTDQLRKMVKDSDPNDEGLNAVDKIDFLEFDDLEGSVKKDVEFLQNNPLVLKETKVSGWLCRDGCRSASVALHRIVHYLPHSGILD